VQALLEARSGQPLAGWKVAATSVAGQQHIHVSGPIAGRLLAERVHTSGAVLPLAGSVQGRQRNYTRKGGGAAVLGDPRTALTWLANELRGLGITLAQGQIVTTGTCMQPLQLQAGDTVETDFGVLGRMQVYFLT
jgi:2-keto-4-pentenoate hydratase